MCAPDSECSVPILFWEGPTYKMIELRTSIVASRRSSALRHHVFPFDNPFLKKILVDKPAARLIACIAAEKPYVRSLEMWKVS